MIELCQKEEGGDTLTEGVLYKSDVKAEALVSGMNLDLQGAA